jgi:ketopantoate reductase
VVSLQNGLCPRTIAAAIGAERTIGALVNFSADYLEPGLITYGGAGTVRIGGLDGKSSPRLDAAATLLSGWGPVEVTDNIWRDLAVRKRRTEVDEQIAAAAAIGRGHGLPMTLTTRLVEMIHELEEGSRDRSVVNVDELDALRAASGEPHD